MNPIATGAASRQPPHRPSVVARSLWTASAVSAAALLAACGTAPLSYLQDRQVYYKAVLHRYPVAIVSIDGQGGALRPEPITAGDHQIAFEATPVAGFTLPVQKTYRMTIEPCTRYYVAAQRNSPLQQDWDLVVEQTWPVSGCDAAKEIAKAQEAVAQGKQPPITSTLVAPTAPARMDSVVLSAVPIQR